MTAAEAQKLCSGLCLRTDAVIQKTHSTLTATTTAVRDTVAPGLIYRRTTSQLRMKKNQQNQQPPSAPEQYHICLHTASSVPEVWSKP